ncbi:MAG: phage major capsid protein, partial [Candidatus Thiodiazotropha sp. 6PLUC6]
TLAEAMGQLVNTAEKEDRGLNDDERGQWDRQRGELETLEQRIADLKEAVELKEACERPSNPLPAETREYELDDFGNPLRPKDKATSGEDDEQQYRAAFMQLLRSDQPGMIDLSQQQRQLMRSHFIPDTRAQGTTPATSGGYLIPTTMSNIIKETMKAFGGIRGVASVMNTSAGEPIQFPTNDDTANEGELVAEHAQVAETELEFGQAELGAYKYSSKIVRVSIELLQDSAFSLDAFIAKKFGQRLGRITSRHYATGTGTDQPQGLMTAAATGHTGTSATEIPYADWLRLKHSIDPAYRSSRSCVWVMNDKTLLQAKEMLDQNGRPLWKPSMADGSPALVDGDSYIIDQGVAEPGAAAVALGYGDAGEFLIRDVLGFTLHRLVEKYIDYGQIGFLAFMRTDSELMDKAAFKVLKMKGSAPARN